MKEELRSKIRSWISPPHPCWQSSHSRTRASRFLASEAARVSGGLRLNVGVGHQSFPVPMINLDVSMSGRVDVLGDARQLPFLSESFDSVLCTGVLEHLPNAIEAVREIARVLKPGGKVFIEAPFMQTYHASPEDYQRWTCQGLRHLMKGFEILEMNIVAGPSSALAWQIQETAALLFSLRKKVLYKIGLRIFGWMVIPISWLDILLEHHPDAGRAASGFAITALKKGKDIA